MMAADEMTEAYMTPACRRTNTECANLVRLLAVRVGASLRGLGSEEPPQA
jgi:hypothetical protein